MYGDTGYRVRPSPPSIGGGPVGGLVTQIDRGGSYEAEDSKKQEEKKKEEKKKKCLSDANNTNNLCIENVNRRHLERFNSCVNTAWFGYFLNLISGGKLSNTPQFCQQKQELISRFELSQCKTNFDFSKSLCDK